MPSLTPEASAVPVGPAAGLRVLICDDDPQARRLAARILRSRGMDCLLAGDGREGALLAREEHVDVVLLDVHMPVSGLAGLRLLRSHGRTALTPVIFLTGDPGPETIVEHLLEGADDYITKPFTAEELEARIVVATRRRQILGSVNPLTGLPGNIVLTAEIQRRIDAGTAFALLHIDLDHFKPFNDRYGYVRGDAAISAVAERLRAATETMADVFLAHIGGDDFAIVMPVDGSIPLAQRIVADVDGLREALHDPADIAAGGYDAVDRQGQHRRIPLLALSIGIGFGDATTRSPAEIADVAAELKALAKATPGPSVSWDRRSAGPRAVAAAE